MFGKLKEKLKGAMSVFSKKAEEEAVEKEVVVEKKAENPKTEKKAEKKVKEVKAEKKEEKPKKEKPKKETKKKPVIDHPKDKTVLEKVHEEIGNADISSPSSKDSEEIAEKEEVVKEKEESQEEVKEEKKGFFGKIKDAFTSSKEEEDLEKAEEEIEKKEIEEKVEKTVIVKKEEVKEEKKGFFSKVKESITTKKISVEKFEELFWDLEMVLLESNVSVEVIEKIKDNLKEELVEKPLPRDVPKKIEETLKSSVDEILTHDKIDLVKNIKAKKGPFVIALFGINGAGKTTSVAKLANYFKENKLKVVLAACDTFRAAAIQQLEEHAKKLDVPMIKHDYGSDAAAVAFDAIKYAEKNKVDVVIIDTAGRLHSNTNLMAELEKIIRTTKPDMKIFVGESITGNDCIEQAKKFNELVEMDGAILTKADVDDKGGAPLSISYTIGKPILFLGVGQEYKDFEVFDKEKIMERLF
jgi:fused signal recognition particle receptor